LAPSEKITWYIYNLRQQIKKAKDQPNIKLSRFYTACYMLLNKATKKDYMGAFAVTIHGIEPHIKAYLDAYDDYNKISLQAIADRLAEALAEYLHAKSKKRVLGLCKRRSIK
jgi:5-methyltetrahydrofolate--homocysteine methyltransferase